MNIDISNLIGEKTETVDINIDYKFDNIELLQDFNIIEISPINILGKIYKENENIVIKAKFSGKGIFTCSRCLEEFKTDICGNIDFDIPVADNEQNNDYIEGDYLNLSIIIEEALAFSLPMKTLCSEECKGLCPNCGQNLNIKQCNCCVDDIDPRLEKLKDFFKRNEEV